MAQPAKKPATYEDLRAVPANLTAEILFGSLYTHPSPAYPHLNAASVLGEELGPPFKRGRGGPGGWQILDEPELHLGADILVPDLAGWRIARMQAPSRGVGFDVAPDWVCEVLSPSTAATDRSEKRSIYAREGVHHLWFVDPVLRTLEVFRLDGQKYHVLETWKDAARVRAEPFDAIELDLSVLWLPPEP